MCSIYVSRFIFIHMNSHKNIELKRLLFWDGESIIKQKEHRKAQYLKILAKNKHNISKVALQNECFDQVSSNMC